MYKKTNSKLKNNICTKECQPSHRNDVTIKEFLKQKNLLLSFYASNSSCFAEKQSVKSKIGKLKWLSLRSKREKKDDMWTEFKGPL